MTRARLYIEATSIVPTRRSGIGHFTLELLNELDKDIYADRCDVVAFVCLGEKKALSRYNFKRISIKTLPFPHKVMAFLSRSSWGPNIDFFLGHGTYIFPNFRNLKLGKSKSLTYIHDVSFMIYPEFTQPANLQYLTKNIQRWIKRADKIMTISEASKKEIHEQLRVPTEHIDVTKLGVDRDIYYPRSSEEVDTVCSSLGVEPGKYYLFVGNIEPRKNIKFLVESFSSTPELKEYELLLVGGDGWLSDDIYSSIDRARQKGYKILRNEKYVNDEDLPALMTGAVALVLPSVHEGFGLSVVQAQACGRPVVVADIDVLRETSRSHALFFKQNNTRSLVDQLLRAQAEKNLQKDVTTSGWNVVADRILEQSDL